MVSRMIWGLLFITIYMAQVIRLHLEKKEVQLFEQTLEIFYTVPQRLSLPLQELREDRINQRLAN